MHEPYEKLIQEARLFLKGLKEEGIEDIYLDPKTRKNSWSEPRTLSKNQPSPSSSVREELLKLREETLSCTQCSELAATRKTVVFGAGNIKTPLMFVGEAPGEEEDIQGLPFVGKAGQLLTKIIESIGLQRNQVFIANVLKCRPPHNRQPRPEEILNCRPYLLRQMALIQPKILCCLGTFAAQTILQTESPISQLRGKFYEVGSIKVICTYHPAYLLRNPEEKRKVWEDMKRIKKELESLTP